MRANRQQKTFKDKTDPYLVLEIDESFGKANLNSPHNGIHLWIGKRYSGTGKGVIISLPEARRLARKLTKMSKRNRA